MFHLLRFIVTKVLLKIVCQPYYYVPIICLSQTREFWFLQKNQLGLFALNTVNLLPKAFSKVIATLPQHYSCLG